MGGVQQYLYNAITNMEGCRAFVLSKSVDSTLQQSIDDSLGNKGHKVLRNETWPENTGATAIYKSLKEIIKLSIQICSIAHKENISVLVFGHVPFTYLYMLPLIKLITNKPIALIFHGEELPVIEMKSNILRRWLIKIADIFFCNSKFTYDTLIEFCGELDNVTIVNPGVGEKFFSDVDVSTLRLRFGCANRRLIYTVGRLDERKGHDLIIAALPKIISRVPNVLYLIGGSGANIYNLRKKVSELHLNDYVLFCGFIAEEDIVAFHRLGEVFVMPNRTMEDGDTEGFGIVFLEANACGKPVIGGACGGAFDAIDQGVTGYLVDPYSSNELVEKILYLLTNPQIASKIGVAGRDRAWQQFRWPLLSSKLKNAILKSLTI
jgi:phosphatidylinositol alpha-1,6-mannosyltransferase